MKLVLLKNEVLCRNFYFLASYVDYVLNFKA